LRSPKGIFTAFSVPFVHNTKATMVSDNGQIVGTASSLSASVGFVRQASGAISVFTVPGADLADTLAVGINQSGTVTGLYFVDFSGPHGFIRSN